MKVSVAMVTFNHEPYIAQAIESVLAQDLDQEFELVIGEDCSTDQTREIARAYAEKYPNFIRLLAKKSTLGIMQNWIRTLGACRGEYIAILDGDDYWTCSSKLRRQISLLENNPDLQMSTHSWREIDENGKHLSGKQPKKPTRHRYKTVDLLVGPIFNSSTLVVRRRVVDELPSWLVDVSIGDWALQILSTLHGDIGFIDEEMSQHRIHAGGCYTSLDRVTQRRLILETRRFFVPMLTGHFSALIRKADFHDMLRLANIYEQQGDYSRAKEYLAYCSLNLKDRGKKSISQVYRRLLRVRLKALFKVPH